MISPTDSELLMRFSQKSDHEAFRLLVKRHGGLVHTVCRRVLHDEHDAEDAFQATFIVLATRAKSIRCEDSVVSWLFQVARRTAVRAAIQRRRAPQNLKGEPVGDAEQMTAIEQRETFEVLSSELSRLPETYRLPIILMYLQGRSRSEAAEELDCTEASLKARLARGRRLLRLRLAQRGIAFSLVFAACEFTNKLAQSAPMPATLVDQTANSVFHFQATGQPGVGCSANTVALAKGLPTMAVSTFPKTLVAAALIAAAGVATIFAVNSRRANAQLPIAGSSPSDLSIVDSAVTLPTEQQTAAKITTEVLVQAVGATPGNAAAVTASDLNAADKLAVDKSNSRDVVSEDTLVGQSNTGTPGLFGGTTRGGTRTSGVFNNSLQSPSMASVDLKVQSPSEQKILAALDELTEIAFVDTPLSDVIEYLANLHKIPIILDEVALSDEGIAPDEPINHELQGIKFSSGLNIILSRLELTYIIEDEVMKITSRASERDRTETRIYPIEDLLAASFEEELLSRIVVKFESAEVEVLSGFLAVTQPQSEHRRTAGILAQLRLAAKLKNKVRTGNSY